MLSHVTSDLTGFENLLGLDRVYLNEINKSHARTRGEEKKMSESGFTEFENLQNKTK